MKAEVVIGLLVLALYLYLLFTGGPKGNSPEDGPTGFGR